MKRVAALLPAATDIVIALGAGQQLVAATHACALPPRLSDVPRVTRSRVMTNTPAGIDAGIGGLSAAGAPLFELDEALLVAQRPGVILTQAVCDVCAVREVDARAVASRITPAPSVATLGATTVDGILADIMTVGTALDIPEEAEELVMGLRARTGEVHRRLKASQSPRPRVLVLEWTEPLFSAGHWVPDMVRRAGGDAVIAQAGLPSRRLGKDEIRAAKADVIVVAPCGYSLEETERAAPPWPWAQSTPVWAIDANRLTSGPGPGVIHGIEVLAGILHPGLFGQPSTHDARQISPLTSDL